MLEDLDLVLLGQLLEHVGEPLVVERRDHLAAPLGRQVVDHRGRVGRAQVGERRDQVDGALAGLAAGEAVDVAPLDDVRLRPAPEALGRLLDGDPGEHPVAAAGLLHRDVEDHALDVAAAHLDLAVEHLADDQGLGRALREAAHVEQPGGDHLAGVDGGDPGHRHEDLAAAEHLDHQPDHPRLRDLGGRAGAHHHHHVAHLAHLVALGVEHRQPGEAGREDAVRRGAHGGKL